MSFAVFTRHARAWPGHPRLTSLAGPKAWMAGSSPAMTADISCCVLRTGMTAGSPHRPLGLDLPLRHDAIAAALLGLVERTVAAVDQIFHGFAELELADPDRHGD